jgi:hypothetical protein
VLVLLGLVFVGDERGAELLSKLGDRLVIVADDKGDVGEGLGQQANVHCHCFPSA